MKLSGRPGTYLVLLALLVVCACQAETTSSGNISADEFLAAPPAGALLLDVRTRQEFAVGHIAGAMNVPHDELATRVSELPGGPDRTLIVYCKSGRRAGLATSVLVDAGYSKILHLEGDMNAWRAAGRPLEIP
ncbi:MAG: rhodanese-like domain-containing protein [bacterium]|nr:sulfurtransferase [Deltaproteobacteria bacterium]MCP4904361.1 rhodanese-like domain-containing protein [bacterium]